MPVLHDGIDPEIRHVDVRGVGRVGRVPKPESRIWIEPGKLLGEEPLEWDEDESAIMCDLPDNPLAADDFVPCRQRMPEGLAEDDCHGWLGPPRVVHHGAKVCLVLFRRCAPAWRKVVDPDEDGNEIGQKRTSRRIGERRGIAGLVRREGNGVTVPAGEQLRGGVAGNAPVCELKPPFRPVPQIAHGYFGRVAMAEIVVHVVLASAMGDGVAREENDGTGGENVWWCQH